MKSRHLCRSARNLRERRAVCPGIAGQAASQSRKAALTASGRSSGEVWPHSGTITSFAPGIASAISRANSGGVTGSLSPTSTRLGTAIEGSSRRESGLPITAAVWAREGRAPDVGRHAPLGGREHRIAA